MNTQRKNSLLLLLCAFIWGTAFVAQSAGSGMGACSFLAGRSWLAVLVLLPTVKVFDLVRQRSTGTTGAPKTPEERRCLRRASLVCGTLLFVASAAQQFGLTLNPSTAKAGFLTAMYVVLVPIFGLALGRRGSPQLWLSVAIAVCGLYLLCGCLAGGLKWWYFPLLQGVMTQPFSISFYLAYLALCLTPVIIDRKEARYGSSRSIWKIPAGTCDRTRSERNCFFSQASGA